MSEPAFIPLDVDDPRAPSQADWDRLTPQQRQHFVDHLPTEFPLIIAPEGDLHRRTKEQAFQALDEYFRRTRRSIYLSSELPVYYPAEAMFAPDIIAVLDVEPHERKGWVVSHEGKGLDFALEIHAFGRRAKDFQYNVERFARLRIPEYFAFDPERNHLQGWRLSPKPEVDDYQPIIPQEGRWSSEVLGLDLALGDRRLSFFHGSAELLDGRNLVRRLSSMVDDAVRRAESEARRAEDETLRAEGEARRAERLAARLRELGVDPDAD